MTTKKFDTAYIDMAKVNIVTLQENEVHYLKILPIQYGDLIRNPRLPRKHSKQTNLQADTNHVFKYSFSEICNQLNRTSRYKVEIEVFKANDGLGGGDLDNYCKAILDGITATKKIWWDDKQVDEISIKRVFVPEYIQSYIELRISTISNFDV